MKAALGGKDFSSDLSTYLSTEKFNLATLMKKIIAGHKEIVAFKANYQMAVESIAEMTKQMATLTTRSDDLHEQKDATINMIDCSELGKKCCG